LANDVGNNTRQKAMANKTYYREVTVCQNDLYTVDCTAGLVTGFDHDAGSNVQ